MMEVEYHKDFRHNYLILKNTQVPVDIYQCKMITGNRIKGLLPCKERHINGDMLLYYEITSKQSIASLYETGSITMSQMKMIFRQLQLLGESISKFLLNESCLILNPEYIYVDVETEELFFLYYPFEVEETNMKALLEFLVDKVNKDEAEAVEAAYKMLELAEKEQFVLDEILQWFEEDYEELQETEKEIADSPEIYVESTEEGETEYEAKRSKKIEKAAFGGAIISIGMGAVLYSIYNTYDLNQKEWISFYAALSAAGVMFTISVIWLIWHKLIIKNFSGQHKAPDFPKREEEDKPYQYTAVCEKLQENEKQPFGNTVFLPWIEGCENKLYGMGKGNKNHIDLNRLPLTVGKLAGSVDMIITDQSISRRHAKFTREGSRIYMTDLNSTNGTFKNGLRLEPNTSEALEPGDEIRLGKLKFIYR